MSTSRCGEPFLSDKQKMEMAARAWSAVNSLHNQEGTTMKDRKRTLIGFDSARILAVDKGYMIEAHATYEWVEDDKPFIRNAKAEFAFTTMTQAIKFLEKYLP